MSKSQIKVIGARVSKLQAAIAISKANAKNASKAKFRKVSAARVARLAARVAKLQAKIAA